MAFTKRPAAVFITLKRHRDCCRLKETFIEKVSGVSSFVAAQAEWGMDMQGGFVGRALIYPFIS